MAIDPEKVSLNILQNEYRNKARRMMSRRDVNTLGILASLAPGERTYGCLGKPNNIISDKSVS
jgi:hypothetical protein